MHGLDVDDIVSGTYLLMLRALSDVDRPSVEAAKNPDGMLYVLFKIQSRWVTMNMAKLSYVRHEVSMPQLVDENQESYSPFIIPQQPPQNHWMDLLDTVEALSTIRHGDKLLVDIIGDPVGRTPERHKVNRARRALKRKITTTS